MRALIYTVFSLILTILFAGDISAQTGIIYTFAPYSACNIAIDNTGKLYSAQGTTVVRIDSGGSTTVTCGGGLSYGDGGPATAAMLGNATDIAFDADGNMYVADDSVGVIRKVNASGIITTIAGNHTSGAGYTGDGGMATAAQLHCNSLCLDTAGNVYVGDALNGVLQKISTTGIITTIAGTGIPGFSGDGGPATAAQIQYGGSGTTWGLTSDHAGNIYISDGNSDCVRKINSSGIITTFAGNWDVTPSGIGGPATAASVYFPQGLATDNQGNLYIAQWHNCVVTSVGADGIMNKVAGNFYSMGFGGDGGPATAASLNAISDVAIDPYGNLYISDCHNNRVRKVSSSYIASTHTTDSIRLVINSFCNAPQYIITTPTYNPAYVLNCIFGDGDTAVTVLSPGYSGGGRALLTHTYDHSGTYTVSVRLLHGGVCIDSSTFSYEHKLCYSLSCNNYLDLNGNCTEDANEPKLKSPLLIEIDSNGVSIDTISSTSGLYQTTQGNTGDIYAFKIISSPPGLHLTCPTSGIIFDTLTNSAFSNQTNSFGFECNTSGSFDLGLYAEVPVTGINDQWGNIYVSNSYCLPTSGNVTLHYDQHYKVATSGGIAIDVRPTPTSYTDSTISWDISALSAYDMMPIDLYYAIWRHPDSPIVVGYPAKSYYTVSPTSGDVNASNNFETRIDTVRGGCDPNHISVTPSGYIAAGTRLRYEIAFTNTGNDTTYNVYVMDTLSEFVDMSSYRLTMSSADMIITKIRDNSYNILRFDFPNIYLLDSMHHPDDCTRGVIYEVDVKAGLPYDTQITNRAGIYFDFNPVVMTNTAVNIIGAPSNITKISNEQELLIYPNPANSTLYIEHAPTGVDYTIISPVGTVVQKGTLHGKIDQLAIENLPQAAYILKIGNSTMRKFIKL